MGIEKDLVGPTLGNVALLNLDLDHQARKAALTETAAHLEALAKLPPLSPGAVNVMRMVTGMTPGWGDLHTWYGLMAEGLRAKADARYGDEA